jgi:hypothetical protein
MHLQAVSNFQRLREMRKKRDQALGLFPPEGPVSMRAMKGEGDEPVRRFMKPSGEKMGDVKRSQEITVNLAASELMHRKKVTL